MVVEAAAAAWWQCGNGGGSLAAAAWWQLGSGGSGSAAVPAQHGGGCNGSSLAAA